MKSLRGFNTEDLIKELESREGVKSTNVYSDEFSKIQVSGNGDKHLRHIKGYGPLIILEIKR